MTNNVLVERRSGSSTRLKMTQGKDELESWVLQSGPSLASLASSFGLRRRD